MSKESNSGHLSTGKKGPVKQDATGPMPMKRRLAMGLDVDVENDPNGEGYDKSKKIGNNQGKTY